MTLKNHINTYIFSIHTLHSLCWTVKIKLKKTLAFSLIQLNYGWQRAADSFFLTTIWKPKQREEHSSHLQSPHLQAIKSTADKAKSVFLYKASMERKWLLCCVPRLLISHLSHSVTWKYTLGRCSVNWNILNAIE